MTTRLSHGERRHLTASPAHLHQRGVPGPTFYEMGDEFPCGLLGFHLGILADGMEASRMDLYDRRFTVGDGRASLRSSMTDG